MPAPIGLFLPHLPSLAHVQWLLYKAGKVRTGWLWLVLWMSSVPGWLLGRSSFREMAFAEYSWCGLYFCRLKLEQLKSRGGSGSFSPWALWSLVQYIYYMVFIQRLRPQYRFLELYSLVTISSTWNYVFVQISHTVFFSSVIMSSELQLPLWLWMLISVFFWDYLAWFSSLKWLHVSQHLKRVISYVLSSFKVIKGERSVHNTERTWWVHE